uniref:Uncharacterized protein n=1 Tax=Heterosigma akashiwo TaxID=2829 RepID=A0A7S3XR11_HETAK
MVEGWKAGEAQEAASEEDAEVPPTAAPMEPEELSASMGSYASGSGSTEEELQTLSSHPVERRHKRCRPAAVSSDPESMRVTPAPEALAPLMKPLDQQGPDLVEEAESPHESAPTTDHSEMEGHSDVGASDEDSEDEWGHEDQEKEKDSEGELEGGQSADTAGQATPKLMEGWKTGEAQEAASEEGAEVPPTAAIMEQEELSTSMGSYASGSDNTEEELETWGEHRGASYSCSHGARGVERIHGQLCFRLR